VSTGYVWANRAKRSVSVDAKQPEGRAILRRLAERSDVFLTNMGPGAAERVGLGWDSLRELNPRLIYCTVSGYGMSGPYADVKAYDLLVQGEAGVLATTGYPDKPAKVGVPIPDIGAGMYAALAITMALYQRERTGRGQLADIAMFEAILDWLAYFPHHYWHHGEEPVRVGMRHHYIVPYGPYLARDGRYVITGVSTPRDWELMCRDVFERPDLLDDPRFLDPPTRRQHRGELERIVEEIFRQRDCDDWIARLRQVEMPYGELRGIGQVLAHPQVAARRLIREVDSPVGPIPTIESAIRLSDSPAADGGVPALGADTDAVLLEAGYTRNEIESLRQRGVI
jgi:itaconate CoA-transferase